MVAALAIVPSLAGAHEGVDHATVDSVSYTPEQQRRMERRTLAASAELQPQAIQLRAPAEDGRWSGIIDWDVVSVHTALLSNGKVVAYDSEGPEPTETYETHDSTRAEVFDPTDRSRVRADVELGFNIFCSGLAHLADGNVFVAGGNKNASLDGIAKTHEFEEETNSWSLGQDMAVERWYPTVTPLANGEMFITSGGNREPTAHELHEVREVDGDIRPLEDARRALPYFEYPWVDVAPDGRAFVSGPERTMLSFDTAGSGSIEEQGERDEVHRNYGSHALYDVGKILVAGGGRPAVSSANTIDINGTSPVVQDTESMEFERRQHNLTVLADGSVLATGGLSGSSEQVDLAAGVLPAELWDRTPAIGARWRRWRSRGSITRPRCCSPTGGCCRRAAVSAGPARRRDTKRATPRSSPLPTCSPRAVNPRRGRRSPPRRRRSATAAAARLRCGCRPRLIDEVALMRLGAVTHGVNMEQRRVPLDFTAGTGRIEVEAPENANIAPPGPYMLFLVNEAGVPSVAKMATVTPTPIDVDPPETRFTDKPAARTRRREVVFTYTSDESGSTFECKLDQKPFNPCGPQRRLRVSSGLHTFRVRAIDRAGNVDPTPAVRQFRVTRR